MLAQTTARNIYAHGVRNSGCRHGAGAAAGTVVPVPVTCEDSLSASVTAPSGPRPLTYATVPQEELYVYADLLRSSPGANFAGAQDVVQRSLRGHG
jgi:hypothetical protein